LFEATTWLAIWVVIEMIKARIATTTIISTKVKPALDRSPQLRAFAEAVWRLSIHSFPTELPKIESIFGQFLLPTPTEQRLCFMHTL
jgi:hypothetical protein